MNDRTIALEALKESIREAISAAESVGHPQSGGAAFRRAKEAEESVWSAIAALESGSQSVVAPAANINEPRTDILLMSEGCYSDYQNSAFRALKPFSFREAYQEFQSQWAPHEGCGRLKGEPDRDDFKAWLNKAGYIEDLSIYEVHLGDYDLDISTQLQDVRFSPSSQMAAPAPVAYGVIDPDYARIFTKARLLAWTYGYSCCIQGSFTRDLDLLLTPWTEQARPEGLKTIVAMLAESEGLKINGEPSANPHGRLAWTLLFPDFGDPRFVDVSAFAPGTHPPAPEEAKDAAMWRAVVGMPWTITGNAEEVTWTIRIPNTVNGFASEPHEFVGAALSQGEP